MNRLQNHYKTIIVQDLLETFEYKSVQELPSIEKITLNCGLRFNNFNHKQIASLLIAFESLTGQRPTITRSVKDNASLKVRSGMISGVKTTLRNENMYFFLEQLILTILPRIKYFEGFPLKTVTPDGHFSIRINPLDCLLLETEYEKFNNIGPIDIVITTQNSSYEESLVLLTGFQLPLLQK
jgi:large subunit ribosomal protein L5